jgi:hypothetical protein
MSLQSEIWSSSLSKENFIKEFAEFPKNLFINDPSVKQLPFELEALYFKIHPLPHDFILIKKEGKTVLRSMICLTPHESLAYFGLIDFDYKNPEIKNILNEFKTWAKEWCLKNKATALYGPINFSTWLPYRLFSKTDNDIRFSFEPDRPVEYSTILKSEGFLTQQIYTSTGYKDIDNFVNPIKADYEKATNLGFSFEFFPETLSEDDLRDLHRLSVKIFADNYLSTPIDFNTFKMLYVSQAKKDNDRYSVFMLSSEKERIGFYLNFIEKEHFIMKTIGVDPKYRGCGLSNGAMYISISEAQKTGINKVCAAMVKAGAQSESYGKRMTLTWTHHYEILELSII